MKLPTAAALAALILMAAMSWTVAGAAQNGDDAVFCCTSINPSWDAGAPGFNALMLGCTAMNETPNSINSCAGAGNYVLGCAEVGFACAPSQSASGKKDCACADSRPFN